MARSFDRASIQPDPTELLPKSNGGGFFPSDPSLPRHIGPPVVDRELIVAILDQAGVPRAAYQFGPETPNHIAVEYRGDVSSARGQRFLADCAQVLQRSEQFASASVFKQSGAFGGGGQPGLGLAVSVTFINTNLVHMPMGVLRRLLPPSNRACTYRVATDNFRFVSYVKVTGGSKGEEGAYNILLKPLRRSKEIVRADVLHDPRVEAYLFVIHQLPPWEQGR